MPFRNALAAPLLTNGGFETGTLAGWTVTNQSGGTGNWFTDTPGTTTPTSSETTSASGGGAHGNFYAVTDQGGPGGHALTQSFTVAPGSGRVVLDFDLFANNYAAPPSGCATLNFNVASSQCGRVDLLTGSASAFDVGSGVLANFYTGSDPGTNPNPFTHYEFDITSLVAGGGTFQIRFAEVDTRLFFNMGVDNVSITSGVPEPSGVGLIGIGLLGVVAARRRQATPGDREKAQLP